MTVMHNTNRFKNKFTRTVKSEIEANSVINALTINLQKTTLQNVYSVR